MSDSDKVFSHELSRKKHNKKRKKSSSNDSNKDESQKYSSKRRKKSKKQSKTERKEKSTAKLSTIEELSDDYGPNVPDEILEQNKIMAPMSKKEWEESQSKVRKVYDEETGRNRLIKGDGEVIEEIVSRKRHSEINKKATKNSGSYFQAHLSSKDLNI